MAMAASTKTAETAVAGPKIDKRKWTPKTVPELHEDDADGRWPTKRKDVTKPIARVARRPLQSVRVEGNR
jgi:hypothetical protein